MNEAIAGEFCGRGSRNEPLERVVSRRSRVDGQARLVAGQEPSIVLVCQTYPSDSDQCVPRRFEWVSSKYPSERWKGNSLLRGSGSFVRSADMMKGSTLVTRLRDKRLQSVKRSVPVKLNQSRKVDRED